MKTRESPTATSYTTQPNLSDCILAVAATQDRDAFAVLFTHFAPRVKSYLLRHGASAATAEDLAQETLLRVWHKAGHFDPARGEPAAWVFTIARNLRLSAIRHERHPSALEERLAFLPNELPRTDECIARAQQERLLTCALNELPDENLELLRLSFFKDMSHSEIERHLGLPLGTIKSRIRRALRHLRLVLGDEA